MKFLNTNGKAIRIQCVFTDAKEKNAKSRGCNTRLIKRWGGFLRLKSKLKKFGIVFAKDKPVLFLCDNYSVKGIIRHNKPFIIQEVVDCSVMLDKKVLRNSNCLAVFKNHILRNKSENNSPTLCKRYHSKIINDFYKSESFKLDNEASYTDKQLDKIKCVLWDITHGPLSEFFSKLRKAEVNISEKRDVDVLCCLTTSYSSIFSELIEWHRKMAIKEVEEMDNITSITEKIDKKSYMSALINAKIVISPWGYGEYCYRDIEGMLAGAIVIKPDTSFVETIPDIYQNDITYVPCKADFSDLKEKIQKVLDHWEEYREMRIKVRNMLMDICNEAVIAKQYAKNVKDVLKIKQ